MASRYVEVQLDGRSWRMPATRAVWLQLARAGLDPLSITWKLGRSEFDWTLHVLATILHTGLQAAGAPTTRDTVEEEIVERGAVNFIVHAATYVHALVEGGPEKPLADAVASAATKK